MSNTDTPQPVPLPVMVTYPNLATALEHLNQYGQSWHNCTGKIEITLYPKQEVGKTQEENVLRDSH